jgi:hypothetical protein
MKSKHTKWLVFGLIWGVFNFIIVCVFLPYYKNDPLDYNNLLQTFFIWLLSGMGFGLFIGFINRKYNK